MMVGLSGRVNEGRVRIGARDDGLVWTADQATGGWMTTIRPTTAGSIDRGLKIIMGWVGGIVRIGGRDDEVIFVGRSTTDTLFTRDGLG